MRISGQLIAKQSFIGTWFVECHSKRGVITVKTGLSEGEAKRLAGAA